HGGTLRVVQRGERLVIELRIVEHTAAETRDRDRGKHASDDDHRDKFHDREAAGTTGTKKGAGWLLFLALHLVDVLANRPRPVLASVDNGDDGRVLGDATARACHGARPSEPGAGSAGNERPANREARRHPSGNEVTQHRAAAPFRRRALVARGAPCRANPDSLRKPRAVIDGRTGRECSGRASRGSVSSVCRYIEEFRQRNRRQNSKNGNYRYQFDDRKSPSVLHTPPPVGDTCF